MDGQYWRPNHVNKRVVADIWLLTVSWTLTWEMMRIRNFYCFVYRQHIWLRKWEVIVGDMIDHVGIYGSRVAEGLSAFNVGLVWIWSWTTIIRFRKKYWKILKLYTQIFALILVAGGCVCYKVGLVKTWWCYDIISLVALLTLCEENPPVTGRFPSLIKGVVVFSLLFTEHVFEQIIVRVSGDF